MADILSMVEDAPKKAPSTEDDNPPHTRTSSSPTSDKSDKIIDLILSHGISYIDNRSKGGNLIVLGGPELKSFVDICFEQGIIFKYKSEGTKASDGRPCWWYSGRKFAPSPPKTKPSPPARIISTSPKSASSAQVDTQKSADSIASTSERSADEFGSLLADASYTLLQNALIAHGIQTIDSLRKLNLWAFMNNNRLYSVQQRLEICTEFTKKLNPDERPTLSSTIYTLTYNGHAFRGATPSIAFLSFIIHISTLYPLRLRKLIDRYEPQSNNIVLKRGEQGPYSLRLMSVPAYIDPHLTTEQVKTYTQWILSHCSLSPSKETFSFTTEGSGSKAQAPELLSALDEAPAETRSAPVQNPETKLSYFNKYRIIYDGHEFSGDTPSLVFLEFSNYIAEKYPIEFDRTVSVFYPQSKRIVYWRHSYRSNCSNLMKLNNASAFIEKDLSSEQVSTYSKWVISSCDRKNADFTFITSPNAISEQELSPDAPSNAAPVNPPVVTEYIPPYNDTKISLEASIQDSSQSGDSLKNDVYQYVISYSSLGKKLEFCGETPSIAFLKFIEYIDTICHDKLQKLIGKIHPDTAKVVLRNLTMALTNFR